MTTRAAAPSRPRHILPVIITAQFAGASIWFAGNAIIVDLQRGWGLPDAALGYVTSAVQLGFIVGTLVYAATLVADRFSPRRVYFVSALCGAICNVALVLIDESLLALLLLRFATGFWLAGIYPVGMRIAAGWYPTGLGRALGYLVGALVLGTAFPHLVRATGTAWDWQVVVVTVSVLAVFGALLMLRFVPDGPHLSTGAPFNPTALMQAFSSPAFRRSALGYFGHMWELYAWWAFVPLWLTAYSTRHGLELNWSLWAFLIIAIGFFGCAGGGIAALRLGSGRVAVAMLSVSGSLCAISPWLFDAAWPLTAAALLIWGIAVIGDSAQFSALNAANAPRQYVGSALTLVNSIGFGITVLSIEWLNWVAAVSEPRYWFLWLLPGPVVGLFAMSRRGRVRSG